nr:Do family serine endopeptidase [Polymorphobacter sp.]
MRIDRSLIPAVLILAVITPATAQVAAPAPATVQAPQNAAPPAIPVTPPGGAPRSFADLTARLAPAVVNVSTTQKVEVSKTRGIPPGSPLEDLFRRFQEQQGEAGEPVTREATSLGSGFIIDPSGYIVTNNHVISAGEGKGAGGGDAVDSITVTLSDRREYKAKVIGRDALTDMALLKIEGANLPFVNFGNSQGVRVGDWAIAIGNPFGLGGTVTAGIVSALHRNIGSGQYDRYIQTDASINQGNSGGPLFDLDGNVIGINTAIFSPTGGNVGLGFSIPAELAYPVIQQLRATGTVKRGYLGVGIQPLSTDIAAGLGLPKERGEIVASIEPSGPAARAGIKQGDVIVKINNSDVTYDNTLSYVVANTPIGATVPIELIRDGQRRTINATIAQRPAESVVQARAGIKPDSDETADGKVPGAEATKQSLGITLQPLSPELRKQLNVADTVKGVVIAGITPSSDAAANGLQRGDIIVQINQKPTTTPAEAAAAVDAARKAGRDTVLMLVQRGTNPPRYIGIKLMSETKK